MVEQNIRLVSLNPKLLLRGENPRLIDEWQIAPQLWDSVRFESDHGPLGQFILTGSSVPADMSKVIHSGTGRIGWIKMDPAAKLVSFSIISCFSKIAIPDLEKLVEELKDNPVAMSIIRARVRSYLYNNHVVFSDRQRIINTVNLNPRDSHINANKLSKRY